MNNGLRKRTQEIKRPLWDRDQSHHRYWKTVRKISLQVLGKIRSSKVGEYLAFRPKLENGVLTWNGSSRKLGPNDIGAWKLDRCQTVCRKQSMKSVDPSCHMKRVMSTTGSGPNMEPKLKQKGNMTRHHIETMFTMEEDDEDLKPKQEGNIEVMVKVEVANVDSMTKMMEGKEIKVKRQKERIEVKAETKTEKNDKEDPLEDKVELTGSTNKGQWCLNLDFLEGSTSRAGRMETTSGRCAGPVSGESSDEEGYDTRLKREELDLIFEDSNDEDAVAGDGDDC